MASQFLVRATTGVLVIAIGVGCSGDKPEGRCSPFSPCGGNLEGAWAVGSSCVEGNLTALANLNPKLPIACQSMYEQVVGTMSGTVNFASGTAKIDTKMTIDYQMNLTAQCVAGFKPDVAIDSTTCIGLGPAMALEAVHQTSTCELSGNSCKCHAKDVFANQETRAYSVSGAKITYSGSSDYLEYCVEGNVLHGRQFDTKLVSTVFIDAERSP